MSDEIYCRANPGRPDGHAASADARHGDSRQVKQLLELRDKVYKFGPEAREEARQLADDVNHLFPGEDLNP